MIRWHFHDKMYRTWLLFCIGSREDFLKLLMECEYREIEELALDGAGGMCIELTKDNNDLGNNCFILWMPEWNTATLVHELAHLAMFIFRRVNIPLEMENTEPFAFLQEYWYTEITRTRRRKPHGQTPKEARK